MYRLDVISHRERKSSDLSVDSSGTKPAPGGTGSVRSLLQGRDFSCAVSIPTIEGSSKYRTTCIRTRSFACNRDTRRRTSPSTPAPLSGLRAHLRRNQDRKNQQQRRPSRPDDDSQDRHRTEEVNRIADARRVDARRYQRRRPIACTLRARPSSQCAPLQTKEMPALQSQFPRVLRHAFDGNMRGMHAPKSDKPRITTASVTTFSFTAVPSSPVAIRTSN